ncbi:H(+)-transporting ATPase [Anaerovorax odorimutans]|uniref:H(+)-transporting ATPase n=1 Tax=Anaerovorax odorimutans TaxID=109327 RepID=A0ABT1RSZ1_9FIRM|nr:potassium transporter TrkG [Anaerovorax odorimutans]MCQ4638332.1 H(+)-transporting ATPase [Anaerovorax odorimutans]
MKSKRLKPRRMVVLGFLSIILLGTVLLMLPISAAAGKSVSFVDSLFTSTSAVCVTGLVSVDAGTTFSFFGQVVLAALIQIGGLGITSIGVIVILTAGGRFGIGKQRLIKESLNLSSGKGLTAVVRAVLYVTVAFELVGAAASYLSFSQDFARTDAIGISLFHSIAAFNNAGFDILGDFQSLINYSSDVWLCLVTSGLIIFGGLGFFVISEMASGKSPRRWSLHTKVVIATTFFLLLGGTLLLKCTEGSSFTWLDAFFQSVSARTAGFASVDIGAVSKSGLLVLMVLMFIGASPGSTGGGVKTTTFFVLCRKANSVIFNRHCTAFRRKLPETVVTKAFTVFTMAVSVIILSTFLVSMLEPEFTFQQIFFEIISGYATTGLSTGITPSLCAASKIIISVTMFVGRLGPLTIATIWLNRDVPAVTYSEEDVTIG